MIIDPHYEGLIDGVGTVRSQRKILPSSGAVRDEYVKYNSKSTDAGCRARESCVLGPCRTASTTHHSLSFQI